MKRIKQKMRLQKSKNPRGYKRLISNLRTKVIIPTDHDDVVEVACVDKKAPCIQVRISKRKTCTKSVERNIRRMRDRQPGDVGFETRERHDMR